AESMAGARERRVGAGDRAACRGAGGRVPRAARARAGGGCDAELRTRAVAAAHRRSATGRRHRRRRRGDPRRLARGRGRGRGRSAPVSTTEPLAATVEALCGDLSAIRAPRGPELNARSWSTEAPLRMLLNNLDHEVGERPEDLVVYGGTGRAA